MRENKQLLRSLIILVLLAGFSYRAEALFFLTRSLTVNETFLPDQEIAVTQEIRLLHFGAVQDRLDYFITFSTGSSGDFTNRSMTGSTASVLYYNIYDDRVNRNVLMDLSVQPSPSNVLSGSITEEEAGRFVTITEVSFVVLLDPDQFPEAGQYQDAVTLNLYLGTPENPESSSSEDSIMMSLSAVMDTAMEMSIVPDGGVFDETSIDLLLNFGTLFAGDTREADLLVRSNSGYSVSIRSENRGEMLIQNPDDSSVVPYRLLSNGSLLDLSPGTDQILAVADDGTDENGNRYNLSFGILDFGMATEGIYSDVLTVTLSAR